MHRVELKAAFPRNGQRERSVPNAPCGVERKIIFQVWNFISLVPNAPCGVERKTKRTGGNSPMGTRVPNAPCGVESKYFRYCTNILRLFLMHRVELKVSFLLGFKLLPPQFLMHRVELKGVCEVVLRVGAQRS